MRYILNILQFYQLYLNKYGNIFEKGKIDKTLLKKKKDVGLMLPNFKTYYKATVAKRVGCWQKKRPRNQEK